jgi:hypothetical protein
MRTVQLPLRLKESLYGENSTSSNDRYRSIFGGDLSGSKNSDPEETELCQVMSEQRRVHDQNRVKTQRGWAERTDHAEKTAAFQNLPGELILESMHHMDKETLKHLVHSNHRVFWLWSKYSIAVMIGTQNTQFAELTSIFGHPLAQTAEQQQMVEDVRSLLLSRGKVPQISGNGTVGHGLPDKMDEVNLWWSHFALLEAFREAVDSETRSLREWPDGCLCFLRSTDYANIYCGMNLPKNTVRLLLQLSACAQLNQPGNPISVPRAKRMVQIFLAQPKKIQEYLLDIVEYLIDRLDKEFNISITAVVWAEEKASQGDRYFGGLDLHNIGTTDVFLARRVTVVALDVIFHYGIHGSISIMKKEACHPSVSDTAMIFDFQLRQMLDMAMNETTVLAEAILMDGIGLTESKAMYNVRFWRSRGKFCSPCSICK